MLNMQAVAVALDTLVYYIDKIDIRDVYLVLSIRSYHIGYYLEAINVHVLSRLPM